MAQARSGDKEPWNEETKNKFEGKSRSEYLDPCQEAAQRSIKCLHRNQGDRTMCSDYFEAYRDCKRLWIEKRREQKRKAGALF
ncbi:hypothetical protein SMACR_03656 [Sordaria macrospora]|uniref:WGS project CABT00000000 data, contig 2.9 n=2 Tax=Sordaria macrospora TaxID=5147 RepID=F7VVT3_SORMK|nr:uncharacterized protein SMAC_03656 [Sordaria macrospora k-hell]KAA8635128.1 hypothetical protein SMACR_03656 [Sordaria macrospora]KAH7625739.1 hypothetical protein B0T09DRAFT_56991 [Sordaria sp. MPI-SDFR-AT-0083]WPJ66051.1 hypothetical protein SMAC4_03656 [Sordaria macrospora]CCC09624.1 unnamed protein product [Sordaria macrospora k-hell]